jgi:hypothetical protein
MREMSNYKFITDAGHGWLSVPLEDIRKLGIADQISSYSYITHTRAYLDEDSDAAIFLEAAGIDINSIPMTHSDNAKCREYAPYHPAWVHDPFRVGRTVYIQEYGSKVKGTVTGLERGRYIVEVEPYGKYGIPASNPLKYCLPD